VTPAADALPPTPWRPFASRALTYVSITSLALVAVGWWMASGAATAGHEVAGLNLAVAGLVLLGAASASWLIAGSRAVARRQAHLVQSARALRGSPTAEAADDVPRATVALADGRHVHRPGCQFVAGKPTVPASASHGGRPACPVCLG